MTGNRFGRSAQNALDAMSRRAALRHLGGGGLAAGLLVGANSIHAQTVASPEATTAAARRAIAAINGALAGGDLSGLDAAFAPDYVNHTPRRSLQTGKLFSPDLVGLKASLDELRAAVPDAVLVVDDVIASADRAACRLTFRGTLDLAAAGLPELTDRAMNVGAAFFARIAGDLVAESWDYDDAVDLFGIVAAVSGKPQEPEEPVSTTGKGEAREIKDVQQVALHGTGTLHIELGDAESLTIEAEPKVLERIETTVKGGKLTIQPSRSFNTREPIDYWLAVMRLDSIELTGAGRVEAGQLDAESFRLAVDGAASVDVRNLTATQLDVTASGKPAVTLAGTVDSQTVSLSGAGKYSAADLASRIAAVSVDGAGTATVRVSESLEARASGASTIEYIGDPTLDQSESGLGKVIKAG